MSNDKVVRLVPPPKDGEKKKKVQANVVKVLREATKLAKEGHLGFVCIVGRNLETGAVMAMVSKPIDVLQGLGAVELLKMTLIGGVPADKVFFEERGDDDPKGS